MFWLMALFLAGAPPVSAATPRPDARELVRQSVRNGERSWRMSLAYACTKHEVDREFGAAGKITNVDDDVYHVIPVGYGVSFAELVRSHGEPLPPAPQANVEAKLERLRDESADWKQARFAKEERDRSYMLEVPDAFDFRITGVENLPTGSAWVLEATPHPGYRPQSRYAHMFHAMHGTLWIDRKDVQWVKADAVASEPVSFGFFIARLARGSHITIEQTRLPDGNWVPKSILARASARMFVFVNHNFEEETTYTNYRKSAGALAARR